MDLYELSERKGTQGLISWLPQHISCIAVLEMIEGLVIAFCVDTSIHSSAFMLLFSRLATSVPVTLSYMGTQC